VYIKAQTTNQSIFFNFKSPSLYIWCTYVAIIFYNICFQVDNIYLATNLIFFLMSCSEHVNACHFAKNWITMQKVSHPTLQPPKSQERFLGIENEVSISPHILHGNHKPHFQLHIMGIICCPNPKYVSLKTLKLKIGPIVTRGEMRKTQWLL
jgi:hypothetical protein